MKNHAEITSMTTPHPVPKKSHTPTGATVEDWIPLSAESKNSANQGNPNQLNILYSLYATEAKTAWAAEFTPETATDSGVKAGTYTVVECQNGTRYFKPAERLCALPEFEHVATVQALMMDGDQEQVWLEHLPGGTLEQVLVARGTLTGAEISSLAADLYSALDWLHQQQISFESLEPRDIGFGADGTLKLILPDQELRGAPESIREEAKNADTARAASIIWQCITGSLPGEVTHRAPLSMTHPNYPIQLGVTLEALIDGTGGHTLKEVSAILRNRFGKTRVNLFESAHPSQQHLLTAIPLLADNTPKLSVTRPASKQQKPRIRNLNKPASRWPTASSINKKWTVPAAALLLCIGAGIVLIGANNQDDAGSATVVQAGQAADSKSQVADDPTIDAHEILKGLIETRNSALQSSDAELISDYALKESHIAQADRELLERDSGGELRTAQLVLQKSELIEQTEQHIVFNAQFTAEGITARQISENHDQTVKLVNGQAQQELKVTLKQTQRGWRMQAVESLNSQK